MDVWCERKQDLKGLQDKKQQRDKTGKAELVSGQWARQCCFC